MQIPGRQDGFVETPMSSYPGAFYLPSSSQYPIAGPSNGFAVSHLPNGQVYYPGPIPPDSMMAQQFPFPSEHSGSMDGLYQMQQTGPQGMMFSGYELQGAQYGYPMPQGNGDGYEEASYAEQSYPGAEKEKSARRKTSPEELVILEEWYANDPRPNGLAREHLVQTIGNGITERHVQVWFQNRRAKVKNIQKKASQPNKKGARADLKITSPALTRQTAGSSNGSQTTAETPDSVNRLITPPDSAMVTFPEGQLKAQVLSSMPIPSQFHRPPLLQVQTQPQPSIHSPGFSPIVSSVNIGRRVSVATMDEAFKLGITPPTPQSLRPPTGAHRNIASAGRRKSIPYPSPIPENDPASPSTTLSPRSSNMQLHLAVARNNSRRASMPNGAHSQAQLISSAPIIPRRVVSSHSVSDLHNNSRPTTSSGVPTNMDVPPTEASLTEVKGTDGPASNFAFFNADLAASYPTPATTTYRPMTSPMFAVPEGSAAFAGFGNYHLGSGPAPRPGYSFGDGQEDRSDPGMQQVRVPAFAFSHNWGTFGQLVPNDEAQPPSASTSGAGVDYPPDFRTMQYRNRMDSTASAATYTTEETGPSETSDRELASLAPEGFEPDIRRASAPGGLHHNLGMIRLSSNAKIAKPSPATAIRPMTSSTQPTFVRAQASLSGPLASTHVQWPGGYSQELIQQFLHTRSTGGNGLNQDSPTSRFADTPHSVMASTLLATPRINDPRLTQSISPALQSSQNRQVHAEPTAMSSLAPVFIDSASNSRRPSPSGLSATSHTSQVSQTSQNVLYSSSEVFDASSFNFYDMAESNDQSA